MKSANVERVWVRAGATNASTADRTGATWCSVTDVSASCTLTCAVAQSAQSEWEISPWGWT